MNLFRLNQRLKKLSINPVAGDTSAIIISIIMSEYSDRVLRLLERTGISSKINEAIEKSQRVKVFDGGGGLMISVDDGDPTPYALKSVDFYLTNVLYLKDKGFYPLYRRILNSQEVLSALACAHAVQQHELLRTP